MKIEHKQILRNLRKQNGSFANDAVEKSISRHERKENAPLLREVAKLHKQIRREVDAKLKTMPSWERID